MAKRLVATPHRNGDRPATPPPNTCGVCGGPIIVENLAREDRFPRRLKCAVCDAEYGTTRPPVRNY